MKRLRRLKRQGQCIRKAMDNLVDPLLGLDLQTAYAINDVGQIVCEGSIGGSPPNHAFLLTPNIPEPSSLVLAALGIVG
jgi:hypothetical protein